MTVDLDSLSRDDPARREMVRSVDWGRVLAKLRFLHVRRSTGVYVTLCAFHTEKTPSLHLWPSGNYFCHGCHAQGDVLHFIARYWGVRTVEEVSEVIATLPFLQDPRQRSFTFLEP